MLASFNLTCGQKQLVMDAYRDAPAGLIEIAQQSHRYGAERGNTGAGLLMHRITHGEHFDRELELHPIATIDVRRPTGWRYARGSHGETWVSDPNGRDQPPRTYVRP